MGAWITEDERSEKEILTSLGIAKPAFSKMKELLTREWVKKVKNKIVRAVNWSEAPYYVEISIRNLVH